MVRLCPGCGAENEEDASRCEACGDELGAAGVGDVEIEVYDVEPLVTAPEKGNFFDETLARARQALPEEEPAGGGEAADDAVLQEELRPGYEIRERRLSHRSRRRRNLLIVIGATAVVAVAVVYGVHWALARMPKYEYAESAAAASTNLALEMAAELESTPVDLAAAAGGETATLAVGGD
ncbi:MAG: zinc ribbon domain-containing protein, partial [Candidatus Coatesbacteria bacterium]